MFQTKRKTRNIVVTCLILLAATVYYFFYAQGAPSMTLSREDRTLSFHGPKNTSVAFSFPDVTGIRYVTVGSKDDFGTAAGGGSLPGGNLYGTWENEELGRYQAFVSTRVKAYIAVTDPEKTAAFNYESADTTKSVYDQLIGLIG